MATSAAQEARTELTIRAPREEETLQRLDLGKPWNAQINEKRILSTGQISWNLNREIR
jgi:hypothetical protein